MSYHHINGSRMNRTFHFAACAFLLLLALLFVLSDQLSRSSAPRSMLESVKTELNYTGQGYYAVFSVVTFQLARPLSNGVTLGVEVVLTPKM
jgi:hypothetical protein